MESLPSEKYKHTGGCSEICPQNDLQALGPGLLPATPAIQHSSVRMQTLPQPLHYV